MPPKQFKHTAKVTKSSADKKYTRNKTKERHCDRAILATLKYRAIFKACASAYQMGTLLITDKEVDPKLFHTRLKNLQKSKKIRSKKEKYHLPSEKVLSWHARTRHAANHLRDVEYCINLLKKIRWIKLLAITGSVAAHNANKDDDIDIFIVTERGRLWITRFFVFLLLKSIGRYRSDHDFSGKMCPNILVDEDNMVWPIKKRNLYVAHEILMMHPIVNRENTYFKFIKQNTWVFDHFVNYNIHLPKKFLMRKNVPSKIVDFLEFLSMALQLWYMKKRKTTETALKGFIHFNKTDHTDHVLDTYSG